jgi:putative DNA primase/helicase
VNVDAFVSRLDGVKKSSNGWEARCPAHDDERASLSIKAGDKAVVLKCHAGCDAETVVAAMGVHMRDLFYENGTGARSELVETYDYLDEDGTLLYQVVRKSPKSFLQRRPDGRGGWSWKLGDVRRVPYTLPRLIEATGLEKLIVVVEGEKDADRLAATGVVATTNAGGAGKWRPEYSEHLRGAQVVVVPDNDDAGRDHAHAVARSLYGVAAAVRVIELPHLPPKGDVSDWLDAGGTVDELQRLARDTPVWDEVSEAAVEGPADPMKQAREVQAAELGKRDFTHDGLALGLGDRWEADARYVHIWGRWYFWDGSTWRVDDLLHHLTRTRAFLRLQADRLGPDDDKAAEKLRQADTVAKVAGLARSNTAQAASAGQWDADPWLLGTPAGTVDLRTGKLRAAQAEDYITMSAAIAPALSGTPAPIWMCHLERITAGDIELQRYLQRFLGYALTGSIREHAFGFGHGGGANGKGVTLNTIKSILGDYAITIPTEMLMVSQSDRHPTDLARLRGVRLAIGSETEEGKRWAESKIKALTGGDPIAARFMRQDFFEFEPQFKLFVVGNHRPSLRGIDEAMRRRLHLVPFTVTIPEEERDHDLPEKLRGEWPAILRWLIDGCLTWQKEGLKPPDIVRAATDDYLDSEDAVSLWIEESTTPDGTAWEASGTLFASWKRWAEAAGEYVGSQKRFSATLQERGFTPKREGGTGLRGYLGLRLEPVDGHQRLEP